MTKEQTIKDFVKKYSRSKSSFDHWMDIHKTADWLEPKDALLSYRSVDILGNGSNRVVFNIGGNNFRMICRYFFGDKKVHLFICWIGTHAAYDKICKENKQYDINVF